MILRKRCATLNIVVSIMEIVSIITKKNRKQFSKMITIVLQYFQASLKVIYVTLRITMKTKILTLMAVSLIIHTKVALWLIRVE